MARNDSVAAIVRAFFIIGVMVRIIAVIAIGIIAGTGRSAPPKTSVQLDTPAVSAATTTARGGAHLHHGIWDQSHNAGPKCICRKSNVMETEDMKTREEQCHGINQNSRAKGDGPPGKDP